MSESILNILDNNCTKISPCKNCHWHIQGIEKNRCVKICQRLSAYRDGLEYDHLPWPELKDLQDIEEVEICEICRLEGKKNPARVRGLCQRHYAKWQYGRIDHPTLRKYKKKTKDKIPPKNTKQVVKLSDTLQKTKKKRGSMPKKEKTLVRPQKPQKPNRDKVFKIYMSKYPEIMQYIIEIAEKSLLPVKDVFVQLLSESIVARKRKEEA